MTSMASQKNSSIAGHVLRGIEAAYIISGDSLDYKWLYEN